MWLGAGVVGGIGLGLGYISPVSTLINWFPDRRGMATGMAIMGFGGGALIGTPLANLLITHFKTPTTVGVWQTLVVLALVYLVVMMAGAFGYRVPPRGWTPEGWVPPVSQSGAMITSGQVQLANAHRTPQFWLIWLVLCMNVSAGIGVIGAASPLLQDIFGGRLFHDPSIPFEHFTDAQRTLAAGVGTAFVGLFSLFNIAGRFFWASLSDRIGRKQVYFVFFILGVLCYAALTPLSGAGMIGVFAVLVCVIASMYGGGFATIPAYLADMFGTLFVGAIHGRLLTAWSTAGILGPVLVNYLHDSRLAEGITRAHVYDSIFYVLVAMLLIGLIANASIRPVASKWHMSEAEVGRVLAERQATGTVAASGSFGIGRGAFSLGALLAWLGVGLPLAWGAYKTVQNAMKLLQ
jgi:MFS family permease